MTCKRTIFALKIFVKSSFIVGVNEVRLVADGELICCGGKDLTLTRNL